MKILSAMILPPTVHAWSTAPYQCVKQYSQSILYFQPQTALPSWLITMDGCGETKGCYRNPPDCQEPGCDIAVTWTHYDDHIVFELSADTDGWVALAFSEDTKMVRLADGDVNGGSVGRNWLCQWLQTLNLSFTFSKYIYNKSKGDWVHTRFCWTPQCLFVVAGARQEWISPAPQLLSNVCINLIGYHIFCALAVLVDSEPPDWWFTFQFLRMIWAKEWKVCDRCIRYSHNVLFRERMMSSSVCGTTRSIVWRFVTRGTWRTRRGTLSMKIR